MKCRDSKQKASIRILSTPTQAGEAAAADVAKELRSRLAIRMIFAAAPSQAELLHALGRAERIDWQRVEAFQMDEYIGLPADAPQRFSSWLTREFFSRVSLGRVHLLDPGINPKAAAKAYAELLAGQPIDIVCLGIGMNGHLAFNDPPANFNESQKVRTVALDLASRLQQVKEGLFPALADVPTHALTLSILCLLLGRKLYCCVSGSLKTEAVTRAFTGNVDAISPASILRTHAGCTVYLDTEAAVGLPSQDH